MRNFLLILVGLFLINQSYSEIIYITKSETEFNIISNNGLENNVSPISNNTNFQPALTNNASFVAQAFNTQLTVNQEFYVEIRFKNTGNTTWQVGHNYAIGSQSPQDNNIWGANRVSLPHNVAPGEEITFAANFIAPSTPGTYDFQWRLVQDGVEWFGEYSDKVVINVTNVQQVNNSSYIAQLVPGQVNTGETFYTEIRFKNTGTTTWLANGNYRLGAQSPQDNTTWGTTRIFLQQDIAPGEEFSITSFLNAPTTAGTYNFQWKMVQDGVGWFGASSQLVSINVVNGGQINNSSFVAQLAPTQVNVGEVFYTEIRFKNTGNTTWSAADNYVLGSQNPENNQTWGVGRIALQQDVAPGQEFTLTAFLNAPTAPGTYNFQWKMLKEGVEWFGDYSQNVNINVVSNVNLINNAEFVAQAFPTNLNVGEQFYAEIRFKNTGTTTWQANNNYKIGSQNTQDNTNWGTTRIELPHDVAPGEEITFPANLTAPSSAGTYAFQWRLVQDGVEWFGQASNNAYVTVNQTANQINNAQFISQTVPTQVIAGETFNISFVYKNTGTTIWSASNNYLLGALNPVSMPWGSNNIDLPYDIAPGQSVTLTKTVTAPSNTGVYTYQWQMLQYGIEWFGEATYANSISVINGGSTSNGIQLIADPKFQTGFYVVNEYGVTLGNVHTSTGNNPAWELAELYSQSSLLNMSPVVQPSGFYRWSNNFKDFRVGPENAEDYDYYIGVNSIDEWNNTYMPITELEKWPAFLIQQRLSAPFQPQNHHGPGSPTLAEMSSLDFSMDAKLIYNYTVQTTGYDPNHHASQFPMYFTVQNLNPNSSGYGQYIWLGVLVYDDRYVDFPGFQMIDVYTQALIWTLPDAVTRTESLHNGNWVELRVDLLPYAKQALQDAWASGIMTASTNFADYRIGGINMGWENPGLNVSTMVTRDLSLIANTNTSMLTNYSGNSLSEIETNTSTPGFQSFAETSNVSTIETNNISIFPNPAHNTIQISINNNDIINNIEIIDVTGKTVKQISNTFENSQIIDISKLDRGVYIIKAKTSNSYITKRFIKE